MTRCLFNPYQSTTQGILFAIPAFLLMGISSSIGQLYFALFLYAIPSATVIPSLTTLASNHSSDNQKGTVLGILRSLGALARACGPILSSFCKFVFEKKSNIFINIFITGLCSRQFLCCSFSKKK